MEYDQVVAEALASRKEKYPVRVEAPGENPVYKKGEVVDVKGGKFQILQLTPLGMVLKGVPVDTPLGFNGPVKNKKRRK